MTILDTRVRQCASAGAWSLNGWAQLRSNAVDSRALISSPEDGEKSAFERFPGRWPGNLLWRWGLLRGPSAKHMSVVHRKPTRQRSRFSQLANAGERRRVSGARLPEAAKHWILQPLLSQRKAIRASPISQSARSRSRIPASSTPGLTRTHIFWPSVRLDNRGRDGECSSADRGLLATHESSDSKLSWTRCHFH